AAAGFAGAPRAPAFRGRGHGLAVGESLTRGRIVGGGRGRGFRGFLLARGSVCVGASLLGSGGVGLDLGLLGGLARLAVGRSVWRHRTFPEPPAWPRNMRVGANSPSLCPTIDSLMNNGTCLRRSCTAIV